MVGGDEKCVVVVLEEDEEILQRHTVGEVGTGAPKAADLRKFRREI
jgi:hypothetical protein